MRVFLMGLMFWGENFLMDVFDGLGYGWEFITCFLVQCKFLTYGYGRDSGERNMIAF